MSAKRKPALRVAEPATAAEVAEESRLHDLELVSRRAWVAMRLYAESVHAPSKDGTYHMLTGGGDLPQRWVSEFWYDVFQGIAEDLAEPLEEAGKDGE